MSNRDTLGTYALVFIPYEARILDRAPDGDVAYSSIVRDWITPVFAQYGVEVLEVSEPGDDPGPREVITAELPE